MGQQESKQRLHQISQSLTRIRRDVRNGKIKANDVERIQEILRKYSSEIQGDESVRINSVYTLEQLIEITSKELDALTQEEIIDSGAAATNSFRRGSSKNFSKRKSVKSVADAVQEIREQIKNNQIKPQDFDKVQRDLANYSHVLAKKGNRTDANEAQKLISAATEEMYKQQEVASNSGSMKRSSLKRAPEKRASVTSLPSEEKKNFSKEDRNAIPNESRRSLAKITNKETVSTLDDFENKLEALKSDFKVAESNKDKSRLHFLAKSVQTLMTDLQMVKVNNQILNEERKELLERNLQKMYQQIDKIKRQMTEENDIKYLADLHKKEAKEKILQELEEIQSVFLNINENLTAKNFMTEKNNFSVQKNKLNTIEEIDEEVSLKKSEVSDTMLNVENAFTRVEMDERLVQAEHRHSQFKIDLNNFAETSESEVYKKHKQYLLQLKEYVGKILEINQKIDEKKKYLLYNIDNNIVALDAKAKNNEEKSKPDQVVLRKSSKSSSVKELIENCKNVSIEEIEDTLSLINEAKVMLEQTLKNKNDDSQLVKVKENQIDFAAYPVPSISQQIESIQKDIEAIQVEIENTKYTKDTQFYKETKHTLETYKKDISNIKEDDEKSINNLVAYIDNVLLLLENNLTSRKSTTEDVLIDIMSISTRVNDLGGKIQNFSHTIQDHDSIKNSLQEHKDYLKNMKIVSNRTNLSKSRDEVLQQIDRHLTNLETVKKSEGASASEEEKQFSQDFKKLKDKVYRYSGTYKNVLYKTIEKDLDKYYDKVDYVFQDTNVAHNIKQDIENTKMILEQRSVKDQQVDSGIKRNVRETGLKELSEIRENVQSVKNELNKMQPLTKQDLDKLDARLTLSILALDNIKNDNCNEEKDKLNKEIHFYFDKIQQLMLVQRPNSVLVEDLQKKQFDQKQVMAKILASIEEDLEKVKPEIMSFVGTESSPTFLHLDEVLVNKTLQLDELTLEASSELYQTKTRLIREINKYSDILEERIFQSEELQRIEQQINVIMMKIDSFSGYFGDPEYTFLDEEIIRLQMNVGKLEVSKELMAKKQACVKEVAACMKKLNEVAKNNKRQPLTGTLV